MEDSSFEGGSSQEEFDELLRDGARLLARLEIAQNDITRLEARRRGYVLAEMAINDGKAVNDPSWEASLPPVGAARQSSGPVLALGSSGHLFQTSSRAEIIRKKEELARQIDQQREKLKGYEGEFQGLPAWAREAVTLAKSAVI